MLDYISQHYIHALAEHPHFSDKVITPQTAKVAVYKLAEVRDCLRRENEANNVYAEDVLLCELWEVMEAYASGRLDDAVEECYDAIAVLMRTARMIREEAKKCASR